MGIISRNKESKSISLSKQEADLLLRVVASCTFEGKDVFLLSSLVSKLSDYVENNN